LNPREIEANWSSIHRNQEKFITTGQARARKKEKHPTPTLEPSLETQPACRNFTTHESGFSIRKRWAGHTRLKPTFLYLTGLQARTM
jgi:hypothetical protein